MSRGVVLFAYRNSSVDYVEMARACARRVERHLDVPVCMISESEVPGYRTVLYDDTSESFRGYKQGLALFRNKSRLMCYDLSPFDQTIVIDADYIVQSNQLSCLWDTQPGFLVGSSAHDIDGVSHNQWVGNSGLPQVWATLMYFQKCDLAASVFDIAARLARDWNYISTLYGVGCSLFRNDFLFAAALNELNGFRGLPEHLLIPWSILTSSPNKTLRSIDPAGALFQTSVGLARVTGDIHVLDKSEALYV